MKKITSILILIVVAALAKADGYTLPTLLALPGGGTNTVSYTYPAVAAVVTPVSAFAPNTNGTITVAWKRDATTSAFTVAKFASGSRLLDMSGFPVITYGGSYTFTDSTTNASTVVFTYTVINP